MMCNVCMYGNIIKNGVRFEIIGTKNVISIDAILTIKHI